MATDGVNLLPAQTISLKTEGLSISVAKNKLADWLHLFLVFLTLMVFLMVFIGLLSKADLNSNKSPLERAFSGFVSTAISPFSPQRALAILTRSN